MKIQSTSGLTVLEHPGPPMRHVRGSSLLCLVRKFAVILFSYLCRGRGIWLSLFSPSLFNVAVCYPCLGELQRKIGLKVLEMGGNAVVGYLQCFDLEGESGLVVRAIGTACTLDKLSSGSAPNTNTHIHPNTAPASNACNSPSKDGKEWVWTSNTSMDPPFFMCKFHG